MSVNRSEFDEKLKLLYSEQKSNKTIWNKKRLLEVIQMLIEYKNVKSTKSSSYYHCIKLYEIIKHDGENHLILKRKKEKNQLIYVIAIEDYYEKLLEAHIQTGHGGRDRMLYYIRNKWRISRQACELFIQCCESCNRKKSFSKKIIEPINSEGFNIRGQVDIIDFQSCSDGDYKWIMNYQDYATKFIQLRPLKSKHAANIAEELLTIFCTFGAPQILQSNNGQVFVASVVTELTRICHIFKIVHGHSRHPSNQESDIENMIRAWMVDNKSTNWSHGIYEVQWAKNTTKHKILNLTPYEAVFGPIRAGLKITNLPDEILNQLSSEEDLENALEAYTNKTSVDSVPENLVEVILSPMEEDDPIAF
ncbi:KRAB-A domain-containing protein 2-like [Leptopilina boulardi]|uniref:KRAB-A domain-containing protein 2-like n=1 Tax=Leptopilina boulardi TaxID=63433 RepID=UPI0021F580FE|nr:KRAB-A domain-containing protein 2-like [Leptopilina boulardi]